MDNQKPTTKKNKVESAAERNAIKGDYNKWKESISYNDLVKFLKTCYNDYNAHSQDLSLPKDYRIAYLDQATGFKKALEYIERQA
jgi:hypothetical protein